MPQADESLGKFHACVVQCLIIVAEALKPVITNLVSEEDVKNFKHLSDTRHKASLDDPSVLLGVICAFWKSKSIGKAFNNNCHSQIWRLREIRNIACHNDSLSRQKTESALNDAKAVLKAATVPEQYVSKIEILEKKLESHTQKTIKIAQHLVYVAKERKSLSYQAVCDFAKLRNKGELFKRGYLDDINDISNEHAGVLLSVLVVGSNKMPGKPFFNKAVNHWCRDLSSQSNKSFAFVESKRVYKAAEDGELRFFMNDSFFTNAYKPNGYGQLPYDMGNIGDLLKHGMMTEFIHWWDGMNPAKEEFVFLDPFCGLRWKCPANKKALGRLDDLRKHGHNFAILSAQPDIDKFKYYGSTYVVINQTLRISQRKKLLPIIHVSDELSDNMTVLEKSNKNIKELKCPGFSKDDGFSILKPINCGCISADMVLIDPFYDMSKIKELTPKIAEASQKTAVVLFVLIKKSDTSEWEDICDKLNKNSITLTCPSLKGTTVRGECYYNVGVILISHLLASAEATKLRNKLTDYAAALTDIAGKSLDGQTITCK